MEEVEYDGSFNSKNIAPKGFSWSTIASWADNVSPWDGTEHSSGRGRLMNIHDNVYNHNSLHNDTSRDKAT